MRIVHVYEGHERVFSGEGFTSFVAFYIEIQKFKSSKDFYLHSIKKTIQVSYKFKVEKIIDVDYYSFPTRLLRLLSDIEKKHSVYLTIRVKK